MSRDGDPSAGIREAPGVWRVLSDLAATAALLWDRGWAERNAGNLSYDVTDLWPATREAPASGVTRLGAAFPELGGRLLLVTAAGSRMRDLAREPDVGCGILRVVDDGTGYAVVWAGAAPFEPTSELPSHVAIQASLRRHRAAHRAVVHAHPTELLALSHDPALADEARLNGALSAMHPEVVVIVPQGVALVPYVLPGTVAQGAAAGAAMEHHEVALWAKHGAVAVGADFGGAFDLLDTANKAARLLLLCRAAGYQPEGISAAEVEALRQAYSGRGAS